MNTKPSCTFDLTFSPSLDNGSPQHFTGVAYSGHSFEHGKLGTVAIDLGSLKFKDSVFCLLNHDPNQRVGKARLTNDGMVLRVDGDLSQSTPHGQQVSAEMADGLPWQVSLGVKSEMHRFDRKTEIELNGSTLTVDTLLRNAKVSEVSLVPCGADSSTWAVGFDDSALNILPPAQEFSVELNELKARLDATLAHNAELSDQTAALKFKVESLEEKVAAEKLVADAAKSLAAEFEAQLNQVRRDARIERVKALFADLNREMADDKIEAYLAMSDETFATVSADLRELKPKVPAHLQGEKAVSRVPAKADTVDFGAKLFAQVAGAK